METEQPDIDLMARALAFLDGLPISMQNTEYATIVKLANQYLTTYCKHKIIEDYIDTGPESSKKIHYCELCYKSFSQKE